MPFLALHSSINSSCPFDPEREKRKGKVVEVRVLNQSNANALVESMDGKFRMVVCKWPLKHWGKLRGVFNDRKSAQEALDSPAPKFDGDGNFVNKISKSDQ